MDGAVNLERVEFNAHYDPAVLEPLDAIPDQAGVQLEIGPVVDGGYVPQNSASGGLLRLVAARFPGDGPFAGQGMVAAITFRVRQGAAPALYPVQFDPATVRFYDPDGQPLEVGVLGNGQIRVPETTAALSGVITREGVTHYERTAVTAFFFPNPGQPPTTWGRACTDSDGGFHLDVPQEQLPPPPDLTPPDSAPGGPYEWAFIRLDYANHGSECYWEPLDDEAVNIGWHTLEGGDVNEDGCINIYDIVRIIADFGQTVPSPCFVPFSPCPDPAPPDNIAPASDINGDCQVNIFDLTMTAENFGLCSNCP